mgnify:FL=1
MQQNNSNNDYFGYGLFNDVEDMNVRAHNRARILQNIMEDHLNPQGQPNAKAVMLTAGYFNQIPKEERKDVFDLLEAFFNSKKGV